MSTADLDQLFAGTQAGGLYEISDGPAEQVAGLPSEQAGGQPTGQLAERLTRAGWTVRTATGFTDRAGCYRELAAALDFPDWFGGNLDALWDCLLDVPAGTAVIVGWRPFASADPSYARRIRAVLAERAEQDPPFAVILTDG